MSAPSQVRQLAGTWTVADSRTSVSFSVGHLGHRVHGTVPVSWGEVRIDADGAPVAVHAELDLTGLHTGVARRDADLRKPHLLDSARQPVMTWDAARASRADGAWTVAGELRVRGTSTPLTLVGAPGPADGGELHVRATGVLDRAAVGIRAPAFLIGREVRVDVDAWLTPARC